MNTITIPTLTFAPVSLAHRERYEAIVGDLCQSADHAFANLYIWNETYGQEIAFTGSGESYRAVIRFQTGKEGYRYLFPPGQGALAPVIAAMREEARQRGEILTLVGLTETQLRELLETFPDAFEVSEDRDIADYLYDAESLATLSGKKLHAKRNHIHAFSALHDWQVISLCTAHFPLCRQILAAWRQEHGGSSVINEQQAIERAFAAYDALALQGALLIADGIPTAFTFGSMIRSDTLCVHVEKALPGINGAYPVINREFVRMMRERFPALSVVNREDDMGLENLRKAKLSYRPSQILTKFTLLDISQKTTNARPL